jgi:hypothetical protein
MLGPFFGPRIENQNIFSLKPHAYGLIVVASLPTIYNYKSRVCGPYQEPTLMCDSAETFVRVTA